jgi:hypothetical protein
LIAGIVELECQLRQFHLELAACIDRFGPHVGTVLGEAASVSEAVRAKLDHWLNTEND